MTQMQTWPSWIEACIHTRRHYIDAAAPSAKRVQVSAKRRRAGFSEQSSGPKAHNSSDECHCFAKWAGLQYTWSKRPIFRFLETSFNSGFSIPKTYLVA